MSDFNAKIHQIRFWLWRCPRPCGRTYSAPLTSWCRGGGLVAPEFKFREAAKRVLIRLNTVPQKCTLVRSSSEFEPPGALCFYSDVQPLAGLQRAGPLKSGPHRAAKFLRPALMPQHVSLTGRASTIQSLRCFGIDWPCWFTVVATTLRPSIWPWTSTGSPTTTLDDVCDRQQHSSSRSLGRDSAQSAIGPFKSPVLVCGMRCLHRSSLIRH